MKSTIYALAVILFPYVVYAQKFNGHTLNEIQAIHGDFDTLQQSNKGGNFTRYINTHMSEFWPHQVVSRSGAIRPLDYNIRDEVKEFVTKTIEGEVPLKEYVSFG